MHWSNPVRKLFSQRGGPVRRSSPVRKLASTIEVLYTSERHVVRGM